MNLPRITAVAALTLVALTACSSDDTATTPTAPATTAAPSGTSQTLPPVMVDVATAEGSTVEVRLSTSVVFPVDNVADWSATVADPTVVEFVAGSDDGSAVFNPGLTPLAVGSTEVTVTDGSSTVTFTVTVTG